MDNLAVLPSDFNIDNKIYTIRGVQVMIDSHLAELYGVDVKRINEQVKRNIERFPKMFMFQLTENEWEYLKNLLVENKSNKQNISLRSQFATLEKQQGKHRKYLPYVFTEQGVAMLSAVLKSQTAVKVSVQIIHAFVEMRRYLSDNAYVFARLDSIEKHQIENDLKFNEIFKALEQTDIQPEKGIFFDGQIFDAYKFISDLIRKATKSIILIDNYIDDNMLTMFSKRNEGVKLTIYTKQLNKQMILDVQKFNQQYAPVEIIEMKLAHDRFLIIDHTELYHIGASLKDLGRKWFAFSKMNSEILPLLNKLNMG
ncbi:MAG: ORF6N domain-containing protein [Paludibacter sp.]|nr:ORF6N domain-containing protein [Paludibacter sp.]